MAKQLLIYEKATPISKTKHKNLSVKTGKDFQFAKNIHYVPLNVSEFPAASHDFAIVFAGKDDNIMPIAVMGAKDGENKYVSDDGRWDAKYIPLFLRRYPFIFTSLENNSQAILCIDESYEGCNQDGIGERLFDAEGEQTAFVKNVLSFLQKYHLQAAQTKALCKKLKELDLLEPMGARLKPKDGQEVSVGFQAISRKKLKELADKDLQMLMKTDILEFMYIHLHSLKNFAKIVEDATKVISESAPKVEKPSTQAPETNGKTAKTKKTKA